MDGWCFETNVFEFWKQKGSQIDLNMMRYIHGNEWNAKLIETIRSESMKPHINKDCPNIQIGGIAGNTSTEHLKVVKSKKDKRDCRNLPGLLHGEVLR